MNRTTLATLCASLLLLTGAAAQAQTLYRSVGPDGRVTFSDTPPPNATNKAAGSTAGSGPANAGAALPYELQQTVNRYPVTLYTSDSCAPCASGRNLLTARGIPFSERMVSTAEDVAALQPPSVSCVVSRLRSSRKSRSSVSPPPAARACRKVCCR